MGQHGVVLQHNHVVVHGFVAQRSEKLGHAMARAVARLDDDADVAVRVDWVFLVLEQPRIARELVLEIVVDDRVLEPEGGPYGAVVGREEVEDEENAQGG